MVDTRDLEMDVVHVRTSFASALADWPIAVSVRVAASKFKGPTDTEPSHR